MPGVAKDTLTTHRVKSSNIAAVGYNPDTRELFVVFKPKGIYRYESVPQRIYKELKTARSVGSYFHQHVKNKFSTTKYEGKWEIVDE